MVGWNDGEFDSVAPFFVFFLCVCVAVVAGAGHAYASCAYMVYYDAYVFGL